MAGKPHLLKRRDRLKVAAMQIIPHSITKAVRAEHDLGIYCENETHAEILTRFRAGQRTCAGRPWTATELKPRTAVKKPLQAPQISAPRATPSPAPPKTAKADDINRLLGLKPKNVFQ